jgi:hypothetical protein
VKSSGGDQGASLGAVVAAALALAGFTIGTRALGDNSFLTHLATGRLILDQGAVPSVDPYTFTAAGEPWVVQSWLASLLYASVEELAGPGGIRIVIGVAFAALTAVAWALTREVHSVMVRVAIIGLVMVIGAGLWSERPLVFGLLLLATSLLVVDRGLPWWLLVPIGWVWTNTHGSFPLGVVLLGLLVAGSAADGRSIQHGLRCFAGLTGGVVLGAVGPLGIDALVFPAQLLSRQELLGEVTEWRAPVFRGPAERVFLVLLTLAAWALARRPTYRHGLVLAVFGLLALTSARNIAPASLALLPGIAHGAPVVGSLRIEQRLRAGRGLLVVLLVAVPIVASVRLGADDYRLRDRYPVSSLVWLRSEGIDPTEVPTAVPDTVGNLLEILYADAGGVFYDDRFDMFPAHVSEDHLALVRGRSGWRSALDRWNIDLVIANREHPTGELLTADPVWRHLFIEDGWLVACRRGADLGPSTC